MQRMHLIEINHQEVHLHPLMEEVDHHQDMGLLAMTPGQGEDISQEGFPINIRLPQELEEDLQEVTPWIYQCLPRQNSIS